MIVAYLSKNKFKAETITSDNKDLLRDAIWIDLLNLSKEEEQLIEKTLELDIPTKKEMQEIELSSRLYKENETLFMTVTMIAKSDTLQPKSDAVTLILTHNKLITIRYIEPHSFALFVSRVSKKIPENYNAINFLMDLLDVSVDRLADILENISHHLEDYSQIIFRPQLANEISGKPDYKLHLQDIGASGDLTTKVQESLITFNRLITFFSQNALASLPTNAKAQLNTLTKDINSLRDYVDFLSIKVNFLLDATLGMINIEQNNIIKIFSIVAVILLPPTLVASIYGMNFKHMPELSWDLGYPLAILLMLISALLPYLYFKKKKWL